MTIFESIDIIDKFLPGTSISLIALLVTIYALYITLKIFKKQLNIAERQSLILEDVDDTVKKVDGITTRLETNEAIDKGVTTFFQIKEENASAYRCIYPFKMDPAQKAVPNLRIGDSFAVLTLRHLLKIKNHTFRLHGVDRENCKDLDCGGDNVNCVIVCSHILETDNPSPFPKLFDIGESPLIDVSSEIEPSSINNFPCWFVKGTRDIVGKTNGEKEVKKIVTSAIHISDRETLYSGIDEIYHFDLGSSSIVHDYAIISRIQHKGRYFIVLAGIHSIGTWIAVKYLNKVIHGEISAPKEFLSDRDFIAVIHGDYNPEDKWVDDVRLNTPYFWSKKSSDPDANWVQRKHQ